MLHKSKSPSPGPSCPNCESRLQGVFCQLPDPCLVDLEQAKTSNLYRKGQVIIYEGNSPFGVYCIQTGKVKLYKVGPEGRPQIVRLAGPGDILGYRSLFADEPYAATAEAIEDTQICCIDKRAFLDVVAKNKALAFQLLRKISIELREAEDRMTSIAQKSARERMAELLLMLKETFGRNSEEHAVIDLHLSREEMAEMIGITQETAIRLLSEFKKDRFIRIVEREITILNTPALIKTANLEF